MGYLARLKRVCKLDAELHSKSQRGFENRYSLITGAVPSASVYNINYYILHRGADKWGVELRIYFNASASNIPCSIQNMIRASRPGQARNSRINNNRLIWCLIKHGFRLGDRQTVSLIRQFVPPQYSPDFQRGYNIP